MPASRTPARGSLAGRDSPAVDVALFCVILMWASTFTLLKIRFLTPQTSRKQGRPRPEKTWPGG
jgi:hypothetical protein